jgi:hypothetical protein
MDLHPLVLRRRSTTFNDYFNRNLLELNDAFVVRPIRRNLIHDFNQVAHDIIEIEQIEEQVESIIEEMLGDISEAEDNTSDVDEEMDYEYDTDDNIPTEIRPWDVEDEE